MSDDADLELTPQQVQRMFTGCLVIAAVVLIAVGLGYLIHPGLGWLAVGIFVFAWAAMVRKSLPKEPTQ